MKKRQRVNKTSKEVSFSSIENNRPIFLDTETTQKVIAKKDSI